MKSRNNVYPIILLILVVAMVACKKKTKDSIFPDAPGSGGGLTTIMPLPFTDNFNYTTTVAEYAIPSKWYEAIVTGAKTDRGWAYRNAGGQTDGGMVASAFSGDAGTDHTYLVTGPFNFSAYPTKYIKFDVLGKYTGPGTLKVLYSTNYSGTGDPLIGGASWTEITNITSQIPTATDVWTEVISNLSSINGSKVYIAFRYKDGTDVSSKQFTIDGFKLHNSVITSGGGGGGLTPQTLPFTDDFNLGTTQAEYSIPNDWYEGVVTGFKTDRGWAYRNAQGESSTGGMVASAFSGAAGTDNTYLVTGSFDFSAYATKYIKFDVMSKFGTDPGELKVLYSSNYTGSGDPQASGVVWTEITAITALLPSSDNVWTEVISDLSTINNSTVYIAFRYKDGTDAASKQFIIDNFVLSNAVINPGGGGGPTPKTLPFADNFNATQTEYGIPSNWIEGIVTGYKTDRGWGYRSTLGQSSTGAMSGSAFGGAAGTDNAYLIVGPFNLTATGTRNLTFDTEIGFITDPGNLILRYSTNYSGSGNPEAAGVVWTTIDISSQLPTVQNTWATIITNVGAIAGTSVYFGLQFKDGTNTASKRYNIDNFSIPN